MKQRLEQRQDVRQVQEMRQRLLTELIQRADLLQTTLPELELRLQELEDTGVVLREEEQTSTEGGLEATQEPPDAETAPDYPEPEVFERDEFLPMRETAYGVSDPDEDPKADFLQNQPDAGETLQEHILTQLDEVEAPGRIKELAARLASSLDAHGYLLSPHLSGSRKTDDIHPPPPLTGFPVEPLHEVFAPSEEELDDGEYTPPTEEEQAAALALLQSLDPPGVGARSRQECLLIQAGNMSDLPLHVRAIIQSHLEDLVNNRLPRIASSLGIAIEGLKDVLREFHRFDLFPGRRFHTERPVYVRPEIIVRADGDDFTIEVLTGGRGRLRLNRKMLRLARKAGGESRGFFERRFQEARRLLDHLEQRRHTLEGIARIVVEEQRPFLENGKAYLKPLEMQEVAHRIGMDVSTVSRAVSGKYVDTPVGVYPLRMFFSSGFRRSGPTAEGQPQALSRVAVKNMIAEIVDNEDKSRPLSDEEIVGELAGRGINVKRRTVNKYRAELGIPSKEKRAEY